jgi:hypothetical protein
VTWSRAEPLDAIPRSAGLVVCVRPERCCCTIACSKEYIWTSQSVSFDCRSSATAPALSESAGPKPINSWGSEAALASNSMALRPWPHIAIFGAAGANKCKNTMIDIQCRDWPPFIVKSYLQEIPMAAHNALTP